MTRFPPRRSAAGSIRHEERIRGPAKRTQRFALHWRRLGIALAVITAMNTNTDDAFSLIHLSRPARVGNGPYPALLLLHGLGDSEQGLMPLAELFDPRVYVISARAPFAYGSGGYAWFDLDNEGYGLVASSLQNSLARLRTFLGQIVEAHPIDPVQLYAGGFSMGAAMAGALALLEPAKIAGAIMLSGFLLPDPEQRYRPNEAAGHPFFLAHGTADPVVPLEAAHLTREYLTATPVDLTYREYAAEHVVTPEEIADVNTWLGEQLSSGTRE